MHSQGADRGLRTGWSSTLSRAAAAILLFELLSGLAVTLGPFHPAVEWGVLLHTIFGVLAIAPLVWYCAQHWRGTEARRYRMSSCSATLVWPRCRSALSRDRLPQCVRGTMGRFRRSDAGVCAAGRIPASLAMTRTFGCNIRQGSSANGSTFSAYALARNHILRGTQMPRLSLQI